MNRNRPDPIPPPRHHTVQITIPSVLTEVDGVCHQARALLQAHKQDDHIFAVDLLLRECLNNAILHGNGRDASKPVHVTLRIGRKAILLSVTDAGSGFDWRARRGHVPEPSATSGRGLAIGRAYAQRILFNHEGNQVVLAIKTPVHLTQEHTG